MCNQEVTRRSDVRLFNSPRGLLPTSFVISIFAYGLNQVSLGVVLILIINLPFLISNKDVWERISKSLLVGVAVFFIAAFSTALTMESSMSLILELSFFYFSYILGRVYYKKSEEEVIEGIVNIGCIVEYLSVLGLFEAFTCKSIIAQLFNFRTTSIYADEIVTIASYRIRSAFIHPIVYGYVLVFAFLINLLVCKRTKIKNIFCALLVINIFLTKARSVWLAFLAVVLILFGMFIRNNKINKKSIKIMFFCFTIAFGLIMAGALGIQIGLLDTITKRFKELNGSDSLLQREGVIPIVLNDFFQSNIFQIIIGKGSHASKVFVHGTKVVISNFGTVDNEWLSVLYDYGLLGLICLFVCLGKCIKILLNKESTNAKIMISTCLIMSLFLFIFFDGFTWMVPSFLFFNMWGILSLVK